MARSYPIDDIAASIVQTLRVAFPGVGIVDHDDHWYRPGHMEAIAARLETDAIYVSHDAGTISNESDVPDDAVSAENVYSVTYLKHYDSTVNNRVAMTAIGRQIAELYLQDDFPLPNFAAGVSGVMVLAAFASATLNWDELAEMNVIGKRVLITVQSAHFDPDAL